MSNNNSPFEFDVLPYEDAPEVLPQAAEEVEVTPAPKKKTAATRIFGLLLAILSVAAFFLPIQVLTGTAFEKATLLDTVTALLSSTATPAFGVLPVLADVATLGGLVNALSLYVLVAGLALGALLGLIALISGKSGALRAATFFFVVGAANYAATAYLFGAVLEVIVAALAAFGAIVYLVLAFKKCGKKTLSKVLQLVLSIVISVAFALNVSANVAEFEAALFANAAFALVAVQFVIVVFGALRLQTVKGLTFDLIRYLVSLALAALVIYAGTMMYGAIAAGAAVLQIIGYAIQKKRACPKVEEEEIVPVSTPAPAPEFTVEEYAEAMPYEGGPVEGVEIAQEVNPTFEDSTLPTQVNTAGYDFYNCKSFDPFIAILNNEERNQFTELFILKYKGVMPEIPDYVVGGDNKEFFRKMFIYLGQYRDRVPDGLLAKMYQFAIKLS